MTGEHDEHEDERGGAQEDERGEAQEDERGEAQEDERAEHNIGWGTAR